jgi:hypothetical protein
MSVPTKQEAGRFLAPLKGSVALLLLHDMQARMRLGGFMLACARLQGMETTILDSDAFYSANMGEFVEDVQSGLRGEVLLLPEFGFEVDLLLPLLSSKKELVIIDDLNSLYTLATEGRNVHQLTIMMKLLSYNARVNGSWVIATAYRTEQVQRQTGRSQRSLTALGDLLIDTEFSAESMSLKGGFDRWPDGAFSL